MRQDGLLVLAVCVVLGSACSLAEGPGATVPNAPVAEPAETDRPLTAADYPTVPLTEPWSTMGLPTDRGQVVVSNTTTVMLAHDGTTVADLAAAYVEAVTELGWTELGQESSGDRVTAIFERDDKTLGLGLKDKEGVTLVVLEDRSAVETNNDKVRETKQSAPQPDPPDAFRRPRRPAKGRGGKVSGKKTGKAKRSKRRGKR